MKQWLKNFVCNYVTPFLMMFIPKWWRKSTLQERQLKFLEDTVKYYRNNPRGIDDNGWCCYAKGCAIGRHLPIGLCLYLDQDKNGSMIDHTSAFNQLPEWMKELGKEFLYHVQLLHDVHLNWDGYELTERGIDIINRIKEKFNLGA